MIAKQPEGKPDEVRQELIRMLEEKERQRQRIIAINRQASAPVLTDLAQVGFNLEWVSDLYSKKLNYKDAIPILIKWLPRIENLDVKEDIVRALSVPWAKHTAAPKLLVEEFRKYGAYPGLLWAIGNALSVVANDDVLSDIVGLIRDKTYGKAREMLVVALGNMKSPDVKYTLIELLEDEDLAGYAIMALGKLKCKEARPFIERFLTHPKSWVRREAKKALAKIDKAIAKMAANTD
jgi:HEAT repeat protein